MKIRMNLKRYHDIPMSCSGVSRVHKRLHMNGPSSHQRCKPLQRPFEVKEKQVPGHQVHVDGKVIELSAASLASVANPLMRCCMPTTVIERRVVHNQPPLARDHRLRTVALETAWCPQLCAVWLQSSRSDNPA